MTHSKTSDGLNLHYTDRVRGAIMFGGITRSGAILILLPPPNDVRLITLDYRGRCVSWAMISQPTPCRAKHRTQSSYWTIWAGKGCDFITSRGGLNAMYIAATAKSALGVALNDVGPKLEQAGLDNFRLFRTPPAAKTHAGGRRSAHRDGLQMCPLAGWRKHAFYIRNIRWPASGL